MKANKHNIPNKIASMHRINFKNAGLAFLISLSLFACKKDKENQTDTPKAPTEAAFGGLRENALTSLKQEFTLTAESGTTTLTSASGVQIQIDGSCLTKNGSPVTGTVDIDFIEVFDGGKMLVTDKTTMGKMPNGDMALMISGGEFFVEATQGGVKLDITCPMNLTVPANLTGGLDAEMSLWDGIIDQDGNIDWEADTARVKGGEGQGPGGLYATYTTALDQFGWTNVDKFYSDPRPRTTILAEAPAGYDYENSAIYLHYDGEGNALAKLDTYDDATNRFSEHYGQIPIGLQCHVIFVTEENGSWRYAIKGVTVAANDVYVFTLAETTVATEAQLIAAINALP